MKKCSKCGVEKDESEFYKDRGKKDGLNSRCKECQNQYERERYAIPEVKERIKEYDAKPENKERKKEYDAEYYARPEIKERKKERDARPENKEKHSQSVRKYRAKPENKEKHNQSARKYSAKPEIKERRNQREKERCQIDSCYKLRRNISSAVRNGLKNNGGSKRSSSILSKLPYTMQQLKSHIESLFESWMNWENHGPYDPNKKTWQIDHIKPHSSFHYENMDCQEFKDCWSLSNLRPLETIANIRKGNKIN